MQRPVLTVVLWMMATAWFAALSGQAEDAPRLRVTTFRCDVTPPLGHTLPAGDKLVTVEDPLWAKGIVLEDGDTRFVLCAIDWCVLSGPAHRSVRTKIAEAANADVSHTVVHMVHQHTAPAFGGRRQTASQANEGAPTAPTRTFLDEASDRLASAVKASLDQWQTFDRIGVGEAKVERVASNRRVPGPGGKILTRWSSCKEPDLRAMPEGLIDPMVKTITFARGEKALVRLHYYATHPQSFYGDGRVSADFVAFARDRIEAKEKVFQIYFTGCEGNVTAGKYNDGSRAARDELAQRLMAGMQASIASTRLSPASHLQWRTTPVTLKAKPAEKPTAKPAEKGPAEPVRRAEKWTD